MVFLHRLREPIRKEAVVNRKTSSAPAVHQESAAHQQSSAQHLDKSARVNPAHASTKPLSGSFREGLLVGLKPGSWAAVSLDRKYVVGIGTTREQAERSAHERGYAQIMIAQVPGESRAAK